MYIVYIRVYVYVRVSDCHDGKATTRFLEQKPGPWVLIPGSPDLPFWKRYLSSQQSSVSHSVKIVLPKESCQYIKSPKSLEIRTVRTTR